MGEESDRRMIGIDRKRQRMTEDDRRGQRELKRGRREKGDRKIDR